MSCRDCGAELVQGICPECRPYVVFVDRISKPRLVPVLSSEMEHVRKTPRPVMFQDPEFRAGALPKQNYQSSFRGRDLGIPEIDVERKKAKEKEKEKKAEDRKAKREQRKLEKKVLSDEEKERRRIIRREQSAARRAIREEQKAREKEDLRRWREAERVRVAALAIQQSVERDCKVLLSLLDANGIKYEIDTTIRGMQSIQITGTPVKVVYWGTFYGVITPKYQGNGAAVSSEESVLKMVKAELK